MGKEWSWVGAKSSKRGGRETDSASRPGCMCGMFQLFDFHQFSSALHQQHPSFELTNSFLPELPPTPKGAEAPRNSLELEEPSLPVSIKEDDDLNISIGIQIRTKVSTTSKLHGTANDSSSSSDISSSPATKTPTLVARLMGLDLLPDQSSSPRLSSSTVGTPHHEGKCVHQNFRPRHSLQSKSANHRSSLDGDWRGTRSLPETPRISSARRSDVEHRFSLQINKENISTVKEEFVISHISSLNTKGLKTDEESRSPGHYARQIAKQVKESVSRKVGLDITNTVRSREQGRRDQELVSQLKSKKLSKALTRANDEVPSVGKHSSSISSSRLKSIDSKNKPMTSTVNNILFTKDRCISQSPKQPLQASSQVNILSSKNSKDFCTNPTLQPVEEYRRHRQQRPINQCKTVTEEKFGPPTRLKKLPQTKDVVRNKQEEPFVRPSAATRAIIPEKKCKKTPLSNDILHNITVPNLLPVKKDPTPPATKLPIKQVLPNIQESKRSSQLSSCSSQSYKTDMFNSRYSCNDNNEDSSNGSTTCTIAGGGAAEEYEYISIILRRTGIDKDTPVSCTRWFSPSHPLDPSIFYLIEQLTSSEKYASGQLGHRYNRRLLFNLVDELLVDILRPFINMKRWASGSITIQDSIFGHMKGSHLIQILCSRVRNFPSSNCLVLEDIDNLIDRDFPQLCIQTEVAFEEEGEGIAVEIEKDIIDTLIQEAAVALYDGSRIKHQNQRPIKLQKDF